MKFSVLILLFLTSNSYSQCAGEDATVVICTIQDPANSSINLFNRLNGNPTAGGVWIDNAKPLGENVIINGVLTAHEFRNSGVYSYTYIQDPTSCTDNEATVTLKIGPYAGVPSSNVSTCEDEDLFSLFQAFDGTKLPPQQNGIWTANTNSTSLEGSTIRPNVLGVGNYSYTYTIPALENCAEQSATVLVSIFKKPDAGIPANIEICSNVDLIQFNTVNLNERLLGEDAGGKWTETTTSELSSATDNIIDVEHIYNTKGAGKYEFTYTVLSSNPICKKSTSTFFVTIEDPIDFTGATLTVKSDICEGEIATATYNATLTAGLKLIPNDNYDVSYSIDNGTSTKVITVNGDFNSGNFVFTVDRLNLPAVGNYTFTITNIVRTSSSGICPVIMGTITDDLSIAPFPRINNATVKIEPICSGFDAEVAISGDTNLANGEYRITYNLSGDNTANNQQLDFTAIDGVVMFSIPANLIPNPGSNTVFAITAIENLLSGCSNVASLSKAFIINATPDVSGITLNINNECLEGDTVVQLSGLGNLTSITLDYSLTAANVASNQIISAEVTSGETSVIIPMSILVNSGNTIFTLNTLKNNENGCEAEVLDNNTASFTLENCVLFIPDGFSPNGDTVNDVFRVPKIEFTYPNFSLEIFNRYGNLLFKGNKDKPAWDGRNSDYKIGIDGMAPNGVYFYVLHFNKGNKKPVQGRLYLNR